ncbi:MAG: hypothetical protein ABIO70_17660 [Pseudomonadota bacterium]
MPSRPPLRWPRRLLFSLLPLALAGAALELGLRLAGFEGHPDRTVSWCREHADMTGTLFPGLALDGRPELVAGPAFSGHPRPFTMAKGTGVKRIFVLGGSAAHGYGFTRNGSFAGRLEGLLSEALPGTEVQVVNGGAIAASSQQVLAMGKEVLARLEPDLLVVYSGNNELLEWFDWRQYLPARAHRLFVASLRANLLLSHVRSYLLLRDLMAGDAEAGRWGQTTYTDDEALPWARRARMGASDRAWAREAFHHNIGRLIEEARAAGVPVVLSTVAANEVMEPGWIPVEGEDDPTPQDVRLALRAARAEAEGAERGDVALGARLAAGATEACRAWPTATCHHGWGMLLRDAGLPELARVELGQAILLDEFPNRVKPFINAEVRRLAQAPGVHLFDGEGVLRARSPDGLLDYPQIFDHCHPTLEAHWALAGGLAELVLAEVWPGEGALAPAQIDARVAAGIAALPAEAAETERVERWLEAHQEQGSWRYDADPEREGRERWLAAQGEARAAGDDPGRWNRLGVLAYHHFQADCRPERGPCLQEAVDSFRRALALDPDACATRANLGWLLVQVGRHAEGRAALEAAVACEGPGGSASSLLGRVQGWGVR